MQRRNCADELIQANSVGDLWPDLQKTGAIAPNVLVGGTISIAPAFLSLPNRLQRRKEMLLHQNVRSALTTDIGVPLPIAALFLANASRDRQLGGKRGVFRSALPHGQISSRCRYGGGGGIPNLANHARDACLSLIGIGDPYRNRDDIFPIVACELDISAIQRE